MLRRQVTAIPIGKSARTKAITPAARHGYTESSVTIHSPLPEDRLDIKTRDELRAFVTERVVPFVGLHEAGVPLLPMSPTGKYDRPLPLSPARRATSPLRGFPGKEDSDSDDGTDRASFLRRAGVGLSSESYRTPMKQRPRQVHYDEEEEVDDRPEMRPRLVLREPIEGGRAVYSGARKIDGCYFLMQVVTMVEPPSPRNPTRPRISLVLSARDMVRDMSISKQVALAPLLKDTPPLMTLHGVSEYVRTVLLPKLHIEQSFVDGRGHAILVEGVEGVEDTHAGAGSSKK